MIKQLRILLVEDVPSDSELLIRELKKMQIPFVSLRVETRERFLEELTNFKPDIVLSDYNLPSFSGKEALEIVQKHHAETPFILITGSLGDQTAVEILKSGATDYILKENFSRLVPAVKRALEEKEERAKRKHAEEQLEMFGQAIRDISESVIISDLENNIIFVNDAFTRIYQYERGEVIGKNIELVRSSKNSSEIIQEILPATLKGGWKGELLNLRKSGEEFPIYLSTSPIHNANGESYALIGIVTDITERKRAELTIVENEEKYRSIFESFYDIYYRTDLNGDITLISPSIFARSGYTPEELIGHPVTDVYLHPSDRENFIARLQKDGAVSDYELFLKTKGGEVFIVSANSHFIYDIDGKPSGVEGTLHDITDRKNAEKQIREQADLLDKTQDAIIVRDLTNNITFWNLGAQQIYKYTQNETIGKNARDLFYTLSLTQFDTIQNIVLTQGGWKGEITTSTKENKQIIVESRWSLIRDKYDRPAAILVIDTDITEKKKLETQYLRAQRMESVGTLAGGIAHDLNNVLAPILLSLEIFKKKLSDEQSLRLLQTVEASAQRGAALIKQILSFSRGTQGDYTLVQTRHLINEIQKITKETFQKSITVATNMSKDLWVINADPNQLHQVLLNLCVNARDAMPNGGNLKISAENIFIDELYARMNIDAKVGPYICISVSDDGMGMPPDIVDKIFEPFFTTKEVGKGTGLGLSTVFSIVKNHKGFIHVYSEVGRGTTFKVYLPSKETTEMIVTETQKHIIRMGNGELILVIDDEPSIRDVTKATLEQANYHVVTASDGADAISIFSKHQNDIKIIIVDMNMPIMDGYATVHALRTLNNVIPIIGASGSQKRASMLLDKHFVQAYLPKPFTTEKLLHTVGDALNLQ